MLSPAMTLISAWIKGEAFSSVTRSAYTAIKESDKIAGTMKWCNRWNLRWEIDAMYLKYQSIY
jgi:hypothetical protein